MMCATVSNQLDCATSGFESCDHVLIVWHSDFMAPVYSHMQKYLHVIYVTFGYAVRNSLPTRSSLDVGGKAWVLKVEIGGGDNKSDKEGDDNGLYCRELLPVRQVHSMGSKLGRRSASGVGASPQ